MVEEKVKKTKEKQREVKKEVKKAVKKEEKKIGKIPSVDPWEILLYPLLTEKAIGKIETENKLVFIVDRRYGKRQIKWAAERAFNVKVDKISTLIDRKGRKKAWVKLTKDFSAAEIATRLGML